MPYDWPEDTDFAFWELDVTDRNCPACGRMMHVCDHRYRRVPYPRGARRVALQARPLPRSRTAPATPRPRAPRPKSPSPCPSGPSAGMSSAGSVIDAARATWRSPRSDPNSCDDYAIKLSEDAIDQLHPTLPGHARGAAARPRGAPPALRRDGGAHPLDRRPPTREGARDPLRRPRVDRQAGLVRRAVALGHRGRGPPPDRQGQASGPRRWASRWPSGCPTSRTRSSRGSPRSSPTCPIATATTTSSATWPSRSWRPTATPRSRCGRRSAACGRSNRPCWRGRRPRRATASAPDDSRSHRRGDRGGGGPASCRGRSRRRRGARLLRGGARDPQ